MAKSHAHCQTSFSKPRFIVDASLSWNMYTAPRATNQQPTNQFINQIQRNNKQLRLVNENIHQQSPNY